jgi:hypothetical protein
MLYSTAFKGIFFYDAQWLALQRRRAGHSQSFAILNTDA